MGREVGRPCHAGPRRCSTDARCGSCAAASYLAAFRYPLAGGAAWPGDAFRALLARRRSWGSAPFAGLLPRAGRPDVSIRHAPLAVAPPASRPVVFTGLITAVIAIPSRDLIDVRHRLPGFSRCVIRPRQSVGWPILPWALVLIQGFGHDIVCISRHPSRESPAPAPGFPGLSAHGLAAPRWCRRAGLDHRLNPLARTISGRRRPFSVLRG